MTKKQKLLSTLSAIVLFSCIFAHSLLMHDSPSQPDEGPTALPESTQIITGTTKNPPKVRTASKDHREPKQSPSPTLQAHPNAPQIPYYLLATTNDPLLGSSWAHTKVQASRAWDLTTGLSSTTVAVIDSGFELSHEDLTGKWYENSGEVGMTTNGSSCWTGIATNKSTNNCDDDQNNYIDDWRGYDFYYLDNDPQAGQDNPDGEGTQHGTLVSGVIGATANNAKGSVGINQNTKILPLQVFSDDGDAYTDDLVAAIDYATDMDVDVINLSLGTDQYDAALLSAVTRARDNGTLVVAASGNCALNGQTICNALSAPGRMTYPALYPSVFAVGATTSADQRATYSSYGPQLDISAPGSSVGPLPVYSNGSLNSYATASGTSFAAPLVAGVASLLMAQNPNATLAQIEASITQSTDKLSAMDGQIFTDEYGYGRVNAHKATLLTLAKMQENLLGSVLGSPRQPAVGRVWRAATGSINTDEFILIGCRIFETDVCSATVENSSVYRFKSVNPQKSDATQYIFVSGSSVPSGSWKLSVHNSHYASAVTTLTK